MVVEPITYTDYDGNERTEAFRFNLTQAEAMELEMSVDGGLSKMLQTIVDAKDAPTIMKVFKDILLKSYGEKSADGRRFVKSEELSKAFSETEAYNIIFMKLVTDSDYAAKFISGITNTKPVIAKSISDNTVPLTVAE